MIIIILMKSILSFCVSSALPKGPAQLPPSPLRGKARRSDLQDVQVLCDLDPGVLEVLSQLLVVRVRHTHELHPPLLQVNDLQTT